MHEGIRGDLCRCNRGEHQSEAQTSLCDIILITMQGIAPTLLVGRVASGHSRPDDAWKGSVLSSLHFGTRNHAQTQASTHYSDQRDTTSRLQDSTDANEPLEESKPATEEV